MVLDAIKFEENETFFVFKNTNRGNEHVKINTGKSHYR